VTRRTTRREFLHETTAGAGALAGLLLLPGAAACAPDAAPAPAPDAAPARAPGDSKPRVAYVRSAKIRGEGGAIVADVAERLVNRAVRLATGADDDAAGWKALFAARERVLLKLNCLSPRLSPRPEIVLAIVKGLRSAGVEPERILLLDRTERELRRAGFSPDDPPEGAHIVATDMLPETGYERDITFSGEIGSCFTRVLTRGSDALINVGVLKDHSLSGVSAGLKNLYGLIHNPNKYHDHACDPYVADVAAAEPVRSRLRLTIVDALTAQCEGGPAFVERWAWPENGVLASTDPVALDRVAWDRLEAVRRERDLPALRGTPREPRWIRTAASRGLGVDDPDRFRLIEETS
jgi:uncharacterized protein (DUF362 family)